MGKNISNSDFFERQNRARKSTRWLVVWFCLGLLATSVAIYFVFRAAGTFCGAGSVTQDFFPKWQISSPEELWFDPVLFAFVFAGTLVVVGCVSFFKSLQFSKSTGADVAQSLGGRQISLAATSPEERRLINVVQEMSIASGVPVPKIFILDKEMSINAFAAGTSVNRASVAVSRGALEKLSRDELQAVIGHEFSHILNGDMQINIRLVGWIFGLVAISLLGQIIIRLAVIAPRSRSNGKNNSRGLELVVLAVGVALVVIGIVSQFFSQIIQAAISRSRERLADASSAQFTRNPKALADALSRIGGDSEGSRISSPHANEFAHLFFANAVSSLFSTHPPLEERIRALDPAWDGRFLKPLSPRENFADENAPASKNKANTGGHRIFPSRRALGKLAAVPAIVRELSTRADDAKALIYILLMTDSPEHNVAQAKILLAKDSHPVFKKMQSLWQNLHDFPAEKRIDAVLLAAPALRELSAQEQADFCATLDELARADGNFSIFEFCILCSVKSILAPEDSEKNLSASSVATEIELALNLFLRESGVPANEQASVLSVALAENSLLPKNLRVLENFAIDVPVLESAFQKLRSANILVRENLIDAVAKIVVADGTKTGTESDLLNALSVVLNVPKCGENAKI